MKIQINKIYKSNGKARIMPEYAIPLGLYQPKGTRYTMYKDNEGDRLYEVWDIKYGEIYVCSLNRFLAHMELMDET